MNPVQILIIGRHPDILETVVRLINKNSAWTGSGAISDEDAMMLAEKNPFDLIIFTNGINESAEQTLRSFFKKKIPAAIIIQHYGGGSGLLYNEILYALSVKNTHTTL